MSDEDWQIKCEGIKDRAAYILNSETWADCNFLVGEERQRNFSAHKIILAMASPVFEAMLYGSMAVMDEVIRIPEIEPEPFEAMLMYIYSDKIDLKKIEDAKGLFYCADKYLLPRLKTGCIDYLIANLNPDNVCRTYEFAKTFDVFSLLEKCMQIIQISTVEALNGSSFLEIQLNTVSEIFSFFQLNIDNESELYKAAERYVKANSDKENLEVQHNVADIECSSIADCDVDKVLPTESKDITNESNNQSGENSKAMEVDIKPPSDPEYKMFRKLLQNIIILSLTPQQFAEEIAHSTYLSPTEVLALIMNIVSRNTKFAIPAGFNNNRNPRYRIIDDPSLNTDLSKESNKCRHTARFRFTVPNFQKRKNMSLPFYARGLCWSIAVNPLPDISSNETDTTRLGIFLCCNYIGRSSTWKCHCEAAFSFISSSNTYMNLKTIQHAFTSESQYYGFRLPMDVVCNQLYGYVKNNGALTIEAKLTAQEPLGLY